MSILNKLACLQGRRDEVPNQELAQELAATKDFTGIREIAENLRNNDQNIAFDCIKVLYEIGYINSELIADYVGDFLKLMKSKHNRMVWGAMLALSTIAATKADEIYQHVEDLKRVMEKGSVITIDNGIKTLAVVASRHDTYRQEIFPYLLECLRTCRPKSVPQYCESSLAAVNAQNKRQFIAVLEKRVEDLSAAQAARVKKVIKEAEKR